MKFRKNPLTVLLLLAVCFSMCSLQAFAFDEEVNDDTNIKEEAHPPIVYSFG